MNFIYERNSLFPKSWDEEKIATYAKEIIDDKKTKKRQLTGKPVDPYGEERLIKYIAEGIREGLRIRVVFQPKDGQIISTYLVALGEEVVPIE